MCKYCDDKNFSCRYYDDMLMKKIPKCKMFEHDLDEPKWIICKHLHIQNYKGSCEINYVEHNHRNKRI